MFQNHLGEKSSVKCAIVEIPFISTGSMKNLTEGKCNLTVSASPDICKTLVELIEKYFWVYKKQGKFH